MSFNSFQNTIEQLNNAKNAAAETDFQDTLNQINDAANEQTSMFGDIEKAGASIGGVVVAGKTLKKMYTKFKGMLDKKKGKKDDEEDDEEGDEGATTSEPTEGSGIEMTGTTTEIGTPVDAPAPTMGEGEAPGDTLGVAPDDLADERAGDFDEDDTTGFVEDTAGFEGADEPITGTLSRNIGGRFEGDPAGGLLERTDATTSELPEELTEGVGDVGEEATSGLESIISGVRGALSSAADAASGAISSATGAVSGAVSSATGAVSSATEAAGETAAETAGTIEETAGEAVTAIPVVGPILGMILEGVGIATSVGGIAAGVIGTADTGTAQQTATTAAETTLAQAKAMPTDVAGKFAVSAQSALQQFN